MLAIFIYSPSSYSSCRLFTMPYSLTIAVWRGRKKQRRATLRRLGLLSSLEKFEIGFVSSFSTVLVSCGMFRASLRSASDPLRDHVCLSCLSHRFGAPSRLRQFHARPALRVEASNDSPKNEPEDASVPPNPSQENGLPTEVQCQQSWITQGNVTIILT
jgi:hypothetical protein